MWSTAAGGGDTRGRGVGARPAEFRLEVTSCGSGSAWRKYPVPGRGLPLTYSPVPGLVIAQESVYQLVMWLMPCAHVPGAPQTGGRQCSSPACKGLAACCGFCLSAAPLAFGSRVPVEPPEEMGLGGPHQSEEAGAEQRTWGTSQSGPVFTYPAAQGPQAEGQASSEPPIPDLNLGLVTPPPR